MSRRISAARAVIWSALASRCVWIDDLAARSICSLPPQGGRERRTQRRVAPGAASSRRAPDPQLLRIDAERSMGGGDDQAAACEVFAYQPHKQALSRGIERAGRLVQEPDRPLDRQEPR